MPWNRPAARCRYRRHGGRSPSGTGRVAWSFGPLSDQHHDWFALRIGLIDCRPDFDDVILLLDLVVPDAHGIEDGLDDAHAIARGLARWHAGLLFEQADHHADRQ